MEDFFSGCLLPIQSALKIMKRRPVMKQIKQSLIVFASQIIFLGISFIVSVNVTAGNTLSEPLPQEAITLSNLAAFHFYPPLAPKAGDSTKFDPSLLNYLTVEVCEVRISDCLVDKTFTSQSATSEQIRIETNAKDGSYYVVNWDTLKFNLNRKTYRVRVILAGLQLGSIDLTPDVYTKFGRTWPVKFLVEKDPVIRVRQLRSIRKSASQIASALKNEFGLGPSDIATLLANDLEPFTQDEIQVANNGVFQNVVIPATTKITDETTRNALTSFDPSTGVMKFAGGTPVTDNLKAGDVLVSEPGAAAPYGYLRKITSMTKRKGVVTLQTTQAALTDAIQQGTLQAKGDLLPADLASAVPLMQGVSLQKAATPNGFIAANGLNGGYNYQADIDVTFDGTTGDGDFSGTGNVRVTGKILFNAGYDIGVGAELCARVPPVCVDRVEGHFGLDQYSELNVDGKLDGKLRKEYVLARHIFNPIVFFIGPIPVVIVPIINLVAGVDGTANIEFNFSASLTTKASLGAKWTDPDDGGKGWENVSTLFSVDPQASVNKLNANMNLRAFGKGNAKALLYGIVGPSVGLEVGGGADFQIPRKPIWRIYDHIAGDISFEASIIDVISLARFTDNRVLEERDIITSPNMAPIFSNVKADPIRADKNTEVYLGAYDAYGRGAFNVLDPEGENVTLSAVSDKNDPLPNFPKATFATAGLRTLTVTAKDPEGLSATTQIQVDVKNLPPEVEIWPSTETIPATVQYFATIIATDPDTGPVGCTTLNIQVTPAANLTRHGAAGNCVAWVTFNQPGAYTLSVSATDVDGGVGSKSVNINVTAAPANPYPQVVENTLSVMARKGPFTIVCPDPNYLCEAPSGVYLNNGTAGSGDYYPPMFMSVSVTDPKGGPTPTVVWKCETGTGSVPVTYSSEFDAQTCTPVYSSTGPVKIYAVVTDSLNQSIRSEPRIYRMLLFDPR